MFLSVFARDALAGAAALPVRETNDAHLTTWRTALER